MPVNATLLFVATQALLAISGLESRAAISIPDGIWQSEGYGTLLVVKDGQIQGYDTTAISCTRRDDPALAGMISHLRLTNQNNRFEITRIDTITSFRYRRLKELPALCQNGGLRPTQDPVLNFDILWHAFDQDYAFFKERGVDWKRQYEIHRPRVTATTSGEELFHILSDMIAPLDDRHVRLVSPYGFSGTGWGAVAESVIKKHRPKTLKDFAAAMVSELKPYTDAGLNRYMKGNFQSFGPNLIAGRIESDTGYLFILRMHSYTDDPGDLVANREAARKALNEAFAYLHGVKNLILDLRLNMGGDDGITLDLAGHLTEKRRLGFTKWARDGNGTTERQEKYIVPSEMTPFTGPLAVLTSSFTVSSGENLAMMLKTFPNAVVIGARTSSVHSDVLEKTLPNGWLVTISNEIFENSDGMVYEGIGIAPSIEIPYFTQAILDGDADPGIEAALRHFKRSAAD